MGKVLVIEPYYIGSHKYFTDGLIEHLPAEKVLLTLPGYDWKWRMEGGAIELAEKFKQLEEYTPTKIICSSMLDLPTFLSLIKLNSHQISIILYFHENQFEYPVKKNEKIDFHFGFIQYKSALIANHLFFNSNYNLTSFFSKLEKLLSILPKHPFQENLQKLKQKSKVVPIGFNFEEYNRYKIEKKTQGPPIILWNHRWEYDKNPNDFFTILRALKERHDFKLVVLGKQSETYPEIFNVAKEEFKKELLYWGYCEQKEDYVKWLWKADILPVTSHQDFFGISVIEAMHCETYPLLPNRLAYPEHFKDIKEKQQYFYDENHLLDSLSYIIETKKYREANFDFTQYSWQSVIKYFLKN